MHLLVKGNWDCCWRGLAQRDDVHAVRVWTVDWAPVVTVCTARKDVADSAFYPHRAFECSVWI